MDKELWLKKGGKKRRRKRDIVYEFYKLIKQEHNGRNSHVTKETKTKVDQAADVTGSIGLIPAVSHLSCGAALFIPVSHVFAFPARVLQSNLPPHSLPPTSSGNTYFLPPAPPCPPAVKTQRRGDGRVKCYVPRDLVNMQTLTSVCKVGPNYLV